MALVIRGKTALLNKLVFELRYPNGYLYLDRCGRMINELAGHAVDQWMVTNQVAPQGAALLSVSNHCLLNVSAQKYDLGIEQQVGASSLPYDSINELARQVAEVHAIVTRLLELEEFSRIGFRSWFLFGSDTKQEAEEWTWKNNAFKVNDGLAKQGGSLEAPAFTATVVSAGIKFRVALNAVESVVDVPLGGRNRLTAKPSELPKGQREAFLRQQRAVARSRENPPFGTMIDVDAFLESPSLVTPESFVKDSFKVSLEYVQAIA
jgi:hypothetical protein